MNRLNVNSAIIVKNRTYKVADLVENFICFTGLQASELLLSFDFRIPKKIRMDALKKVLNDPVQELIKTRFTVADEKKYRLSWFLTYSEYQLENLLASFKDDNLNYEYLKELWLMILSYMIDVKFSEDNLLIIIKEAEKIKELKITNNILRYNLSLSKVFVDKKGEIDGLTPDVFRPVLYKSATVSEIRELSAKYDLAIPQRFKKGEFLDQIINKLKETNRYSEKVEAELVKMTITQLQRFSTNNKLKLTIDLNKESIIELILSGSIQTSDIYIKPSSNSIYNIELNDLEGVSDEAKNFEQSGIFNDEAAYHEIEAKPLYQKVEVGYINQSKTFIDDSTRDDNVIVKEEVKKINQEEDLNVSIDDEQLDNKKYEEKNLEISKENSEDKFSESRKKIVSLRNLLIAFEMRVNALYSVLENSNSVREENIEKLYQEVSDLENLIIDYKKEFSIIDEKLKLCFDNDLVNRKNDVRDFIFLMEKKIDTSKNLLMQIDQKLKEEDLLKKANEKIEKQKENENFKIEFKEKYNNLLNKLYDIEPRVEALKTNVELLNFNPVNEINYDVVLDYKTNKTNYEREVSNCSLLNEELTLKYKGIPLESDLIVIINQANLKLDLLKSKITEIKKGLEQIEINFADLELQKQKEEYERKKQEDILLAEKKKQLEEEKLALEKERLEQEKELLEKRKQLEEEKLKQSHVEINSKSNDFDFFDDLKMDNSGVNVTSYTKDKLEQEKRREEDLEESMKKNYKPISQNTFTAEPNYLEPSTIIAPIAVERNDLVYASENDLITDEMPGYLDKFDSRKNKKLRKKQKDKANGKVLNVGTKVAVVISIVIALTIIGVVFFFVFKK